MNCLMSFFVYDVYILALSLGKFSRYIMVL